MRVLSGECCSCIRSSRKRHKNISGMHSINDASGCLWKCYCNTRICVLFVCQHTTPNYFNWSKTISKQKVRFIIMWFGSFTCTTSNMCTCVSESCRSVQLQMMVPYYSKLIAWFCMSFSDIDETVGGIVWLSDWKWRSGTPEQRVPHQERTVHISKICWQTCTLFTGRNYAELNLNFMLILGQKSKLNKHNLLFTLL